MECRAETLAFDAFQALALTCFRSHLQERRQPHVLHIVQMQ